ncbi:MAG TPA: DUF1761 domain-containing protein [Saprospiraceae bacterium]|jgi:uncharacterized protein DUF1761
MLQPNWLAILIAALIPMIVGFIYYHKSLFGKAWMNSLGLTEEDLKKGNMGIIFGVSLLMSFLMSMFLLANVDGALQEGSFDSFKHGAFHGTLLGIMVAMPVLVTNGLFERKNFKNLAINTLYWIITLALMGGVIDALNHWPNDQPAM